MKTTIGGKRLGSGAGMEIAMHNYEMSTHNLQQRFTTTMGAGTLIPCLCIPALRGDYFDIAIKAATRTIPTRGPLFSTFKMQVDLFDVPVRLYQALLHNNAVRLGMNMKNVKLPKLHIETKAIVNNWENGEMSCNSLLKYLGLSGIGSIDSLDRSTIYYREVNAVPALAYYDIVKNYYANKQEDKAYLVNSSIETVGTFNVTQAKVDGVVKEISSTPSPAFSVEELFGKKTTAYRSIEFKYIISNSQNVVLDGTFKVTKENLRLLVKNINDAFPTPNNTAFTIDDAIKANLIKDFTVDQDDRITISFRQGAYTSDKETYYTVCWIEDKGKKESIIKLRDFPLSNIDDMRLDILSYHTLGAPFVIGKTTQTGNKNVYLPYSALTAVDNLNVTTNKKPLNGICIKTYQSDLFNNWLNKEWVEGENSVAELSKVAVQDGAIYMDALLMGKKTYNLYNRIATSDGTYQSWLDAVYCESPKRHIETPMYVGGLSSEVVFEEIIQTSPTEGAALGTLGGRGVLMHREGGSSYIEVDEPSFIIGIVSITPRVFYCQGNEFYMTDLDSIDDLHKPEFDGIGYQNLIGERMCWTDTVIRPGVTQTISRTVVGKVPAWIEYQTAVDKCYGEFTDVNKQGFMVLNRNYSVDEKTGRVLDFTTYVDPSKYNYAFGESTLFSQNFWVQIDFDIKARRKMSAREIPNL